MAVGGRRGTGGGRAGKKKKSNNPTLQDGEKAKTKNRIWKTNENKTKRTYSWDGEWTTSGTSSDGSFTYDSDSGIGLVSCSSAESEEALTWLLIVDHGSLLGKSIHFFEATQVDAI